MNTRLVQTGLIASIVAITCLLGGSASAQPVSVYGTSGQIRLGTGVGITFGGGRIGVNIGTGGGYYPYQNYGNSPYRQPYYQQPQYRPYVAPPCDHHYPIAPVYPTPRYYSPQQPQYYSPRPYNYDSGNDAYSRQQRQQHEWQIQQDKLLRENERHQRELERIRSRR